MDENNTFYFLNHKMLDLDERQQELYQDMLKNHGEIVNIDEYLDTLYLDR